MAFIDTIVSSSITALPDPPYLQEMRENAEHMKQEMHKKVTSFILMQPCNLQFLLDLQTSIVSGHQACTGTQLLPWQPNYPKFCQSGLQQSKQIMT